VADRHGSIHLGVVVADGPERRRIFIELLAAVGAARLNEADLDRLVVLVRGEQLASLRRIVERCLDDHPIKRRLLELTARSAAHLSTPWPE
jgi:hypothetical protein